MCEHDTLQVTMVMNIAQKIICRIWLINQVNQVN